MISFNIVKRNNISIEGNFSSEKTIVFAHGFGTDQTAWENLKRSFQDEYKLVLYDNVGAGGSDTNCYSRERYSSLNGYYQDLIEISQALNLSNTIFIGHSISSMIGLKVSVSLPHLFDKLVLIGASPRYANDEGYYGGFEQSELDALFQSIESNFYEWVNGFSKAAMKNADRPALRDAFADTLLSVRPDIALDVAKAIFQSDFRSVLDKVDKEVLILQALHDIAVPLEVGDYLHSKIKNSQLVTLEAEGHFPHMSAHAAVSSAIENFIKG